MPPNSTLGSPCRRLVSTLAGARHPLSGTLGLYLCLPFGLGTLPGVERLLCKGSNKGCAGEIPATLGVEFYGRPEIGGNERWARRLNDGAHVVPV